MPFRFATCIVITWTLSWTETKSNTTNHFFWQNTKSKLISRKTMHKNTGAFEMWWTKCAVVCGGRRATPILLFIPLFTRCAMLDLFEKTFTWQNTNQIVIANYLLTELANLMVLHKKCPILKLEFEFSMNKYFDLPDEVLGSFCLPSILLHGSLLNAANACGRCMHKFASIGISLFVVVRYLSTSGRFQCIV